MDVSCWRGGSPVYKNKCCKRSNCLRSCKRHLENLCKVTIHKSHFISRGNVSYLSTPCVINFFLWFDPLTWDVLVLKWALFSQQISTVIFFISVYRHLYLCINVICHWHICICSLSAFSNRHSITTSPFFNIQNQVYFQKQFWGCLLCNPALLQLGHPVPGNGPGSDFGAPYENTLPKRMDVWCGLIDYYLPLFVLSKSKAQTNWKLTTF